MAAWITGKWAVIINVKYFLFTKNFAAFKENWHCRPFLHLLLEYQSKIDYCINSYQLYNIKFVLKVSVLNVIMSLRHRIFENESRLLFYASAGAD